MLSDKKIRSEDRNSDHFKLQNIPKNASISKVEIYKREGCLDNYNEVLNKYKKS
jgi:hypothetical protein